MTTQRKRTSQYLVASAALLAVAAGGMNAALAANNATATATAVVLVPIAVAKNTDLSFGRLVAGNGTVTLATDGTRTAGGTTPLPSGATPTAAKFTVTGDANSTYAITYNNSATLTDGTNTMAVTWIAEAITAATGTGKTALTSDATGTLSSGTGYIHVGAQLVVGASQPANTYTGSIDITVDYN